MKTPPSIILHSVILIVLLAVASYSIGLCASMANEGVDEPSAMLVVVIAVYSLPSAFLAWAFHLHHRTRQTGHLVASWAHIALYAAILIYCAFGLAVPFESGWGLLSILIALLGALSTMAVFMIAASYFLPRNRPRRTLPDTATAASR